MIEKLKGIERDYGTYTATELIASNSELFFKMNELIDTVNELQTKVNKLEEKVNFVQPEVKENVQDKFVEQRKWIGKWCKFWNGYDEPENCVYGVLHYVFDLRHEDCPFQCGNGERYEYCERISEDLIYKGEIK